MVNFGLRSLISDLQTAIGGHHPVLYFTTQITEKYSTAMCYNIMSKLASLVDVIAENITYSLIH